VHVSNNLKHDKTHFYKYTSAETALTILKNGTVRYRSPLLFDDPFDIQIYPNFDFDLDSLPELVMQELEDIVFSKKEVKINISDEWGKAIFLLKENVKEHGNYPEEIKSFLKSSFEILKDKINNARIGFNDTWKNFLQRLRVFSMSEIHDNILMWSHYADFHRGVVFKLKVLPVYDTLICMAKPVIYKSNLPVFFTRKQWIEFLCAVKPIDFEKLSWDYAYIKSDVWSYQKEWRVWDLLPEAGPELYIDYKLYPEEIESIYFGCKTDDKKRNDIMKAAKAYNPNIFFYLADKSKNSYGLIFNEL